MFWDSGAEPGASGAELGASGVCFPLGSNFSKMHMAADLELGASDVELGATERGTQVRHGFKRRRGMG